MPTKSPFWKLWGIPVLLGIFSLCGLICALVGDGAWDILSWLLLGLLVVVILYFLNKSSGRAEGSR